MSQGESLVGPSEVMAVPEVSIEGLNETVDLATTLLVQATVKNNEADEIKLDERDLSNPHAWTDELIFAEGRKKRLLEAHDRMVARANIIGQILDKVVPMGEDRHWFDEFTTGAERRLDDIRAQQG